MPVHEQEEVSKRLRCKIGGQKVNLRNPLHIGDEAKTRALKTQGRHRQKSEKEIASSKKFEKKERKKNWEKV